MSGPGLARRFPRLGDRLSPVEIGRWPTPIERVTGLDDLPRLWVKRDDLSADLYGGSKVRNLEWILGDAKARGARSLLTTAAWGSHLALALTLYGRREGFAVRSVLFPQPMSEDVAANVARLSATGGVVSRCRFTVETPFRLALQVVRGWTAGEGTPYWVAPGGASPIGCLGYVQAGLEIADQVATGVMPPPDYVFCAAGSCGTLIGLSEGLALAGLAATVVGVRVVPRLVTSGLRRRSLHRRLRRELERLSGERLTSSPRSVVLHDYAGRGYARPTPGGKAARLALDACHALELEDTYTAKALAGLRDFVRRHALTGGVHLFLNTYDARPARDRP